MAFNIEGGITIRKPIFTALAPDGIKCLEYPINGRYILIPLDDWRNGVRTFNYVTGDGSYTVPPQIEKDVFRAVLACHAYFMKCEEMRQLREAINDMRDELLDMSNDYSFSLTNL